MAHEESSLFPWEERDIRKLPGNDRCADCLSYMPEWASVTYGITICLICSGVHRSLGVQVSVVKSLRLDAWRKKHKLAMKLGGNDKWNDFRNQRLAPASEPISVKYNSALAQEYKKRLENEVQCSIQESREDEHMTDTFLSQTKRPAPTQHDSRGAIPMPRAVLCGGGSESVLVKCILCERRIPVENLDEHSNVCEVQEIAENFHDIHKAGSLYSCEVEIGHNGRKLGITVSKTRRGSTIISKIDPLGDAAKKGIPLGSVVLGVNGVDLGCYEEIMRAIEVSPRPLSLKLKLHASPVAFPSSVLSAEVGSRWIKRTIRFDDDDLGLRVEDRDGLPTVIEILKDGTAGKADLAVGSVVVAVNGASTEKVSTKPSLWQIHSDPIAKSKEPVNMTSGTP